MTYPKSQELEIIQIHGVIKFETEDVVENLFFRKTKRRAAAKCDFLKDYFSKLQTRSFLEGQLNCTWESIFSPKN